MASDVTLTLKADNSQYVNKMKEAQQASQKVYDTVERGTKREKGLIEDIETELTKLQDKRRRAFSVEDIEKYNKKIQEAKRDLQEYEKAGLEAEKTTNTLSQSISKWVLGLGGAAAALRVLKDALKETTAGLNALNIVGAITKQVLNDIVSGVGLSMTRIREAVAIQRELNKEREREFVDIKRAKEQQILYNKYYFDAMDRTKTDLERMQALNKALEAHNKMIDIQIENAERLAKIKEAAFLNAPASETAKKEWVDAQNAIDELLIARNAGVRRLQSQLTGILGDMFTGIHDAITETNEAVTQWEKDYAEDQEKIKKENERIEKETLERRRQFAKELRTEREKIGLDEMNRLAKEHLANEKAIDDNKKAWQEYYGYLFYLIDQEQKKHDDAEKAKQDFKDKTLQNIIEGERMVMDFISTNNQQKYNEEINALNKKTEYQLQQAKGDEEKKLKIKAKAEQEQIIIEKKYANDRKKIAIAQALIDTAASALGAYLSMVKIPFVGPLLATKAAIQATILGMLQVGLIAAQKFAKGGWTGKGGDRDETGERVAGIVHEEEFVVKKGPAHKFREVLEAINKEDHNMIVTRFNKLSPETLTVSAPSVNNSVSVDNNGSNSRLDQVIKEQRKLNEKFSKQRQVSVVNGKTIITEGNKTRILA